MCLSCYGMYYVVFYDPRSHSTAPWTHGSSSAPPRVEVISGLVRQHHVAPRRRFRKDGREASKLATRGGRQNKYSWRSRRGETNEAW